MGESERQETSDSFRIGINSFMRMEPSKPNRFSEVSLLTCLGYNIQTIAIEVKKKMNMVLFFQFSAMRIYLYMGCIVRYFMNLRRDLETNSCLRGRVPYAVNWLGTLCEDQGSE